MSEYPEFVFISYDQDISTQTYDIAVSCEAGSLVGKPVKYVRHDLNTRAVPDVPELVNVAHMVEFEDTDLDGERFKAFHHSYLGYPNAFPVVRRDQSAEIIAVKDKEIERLKLRHTDEMNDFILMGMARDEFKNRAEAAEAKLAQYEAQEPAAWLCEKLDGDDRFSKVVCNPLSVEQFGELGGEVTPPYASPAPAADLKAENERLREALKPFAQLAGYYSKSQLGLPAEAIVPEVDDLFKARAVLNPSEPQND